jgi:hypothetical protein
VPTSPSANRLASSVIIAVGACALALAVGLPFLYVEVRVADFYNYASAGFGYWMATRVLPGWAVFSVLLGTIIGVRSSKSGRGLFASLLWAGAWSLGLAIVATAISFGTMASYRATGAARGTLPPTPLSHVLFHHLFDSKAEQKVQFDLCILSAEGPYSNSGGTRSFRYEFCIPDVDSLRYQVSVIDTTTRFVGPPVQTRCGSGRVLCVGSTRQPNPRHVLLALGGLSFVRRVIATEVQE